MQKIATIQAWDLMTQVMVIASVRTYADNGSTLLHEPEEFRVLVDGKGEADTPRWLRDALVALAETL